MVKKGRLLINRHCSAQDNMDMDLLLLKAYSLDRSPVLRIYGWKQNSISYGYSQNIEKLLDVKKACQLGWDIVRRPTGGGIVFHNRDEITYSFVASYEDLGLEPSLQKSYKLISSVLAQALLELGVKVDFAFKKTSGLRDLCFAYPSNHEITFQGRKLVGNAQKKIKDVFLQQGSVFVSMPKGLDKILRKGSFSQLKKKAVCLTEVFGKKIDFDKIAQVLIAAFRKGLNIDFQK